MYDNEDTKNKQREKRKKERKSERVRVRHCNEKGEHAKEREHTSTLLLYFIAMLSSTVRQAKLRKAFSSLNEQISGINTARIKKRVKMQST